MTPFWDAPQTYWASTDVKATSALDYSYPDYDEIDDSNSDTIATAISKRVNELYASSFTGATKTGPASQSRAPSQHYPSVHPTVVAPPNLGIWDWTARGEFKKYEFGTSFSVLNFLSQVPENHREWRRSLTYVGSHHAFVNSTARSCASCSNQQDLVVEGFVHLNNAIARHSGLNSLESNVVGPYLTEKAIQKPRFPHFNPGFPKCLGGNPGFLMQPEFRIFKVRFSSERCRNRGKKDKVKIQET